MEDTQTKKSPRTPGKSSDRVNGISQKSGNFSREDEILSNLQKEHGLELEAQKLRDRERELSLGHELEKLKLEKEGELKLRAEVENFEREKREFAEQKNQEELDMFKRNLEAKFL